MPETIPFGGLPVRAFCLYIAMLLPDFVPLAGFHKVLCSTGWRACAGEAKHQWLCGHGVLHPGYRYDLVLPSVAHLLRVRPWALYASMALHRDTCKLVMQVMQVPAGV